MSIFPMVGARALNNAHTIKSIVKKALILAAFVMFTSKISVFIDVIICGFVTEWRGTLQHLVAKVTQKIMSKEYQNNPNVILCMLSSILVMRLFICKERLKQWTS